MDGPLSLPSVADKRIFLMIYRMTLTFLFDNWFVNTALRKLFEYNSDLMTRNIIFAHKRKRKKHNFNLIFLLTENRFSVTFFEQIYNQNNDQDHTNLRKFILINRISFSSITISIMFFSLISVYFIFLKSWNRNRFLNQLKSFYRIFVR